MINYQVSLGRCGCTDCALRLSRGNIEARDYAIESIPWLILEGWYDPNQSRRIPSELGKYIWNTFDSDNYWNVSV